MSIHVHASVMYMCMRNEKFQLLKRGRSWQARKQDVHLYKCSAYTTLSTQRLYTRKQAATRATHTIRIWLRLTYDSTFSNWFRNDLTGDNCMSTLQQTFIRSRHAYAARHYAQALAALLASQPCTLPARSSAHSSSGILTHNEMQILSVL